jgi:2-aminoethylphosphonate aminotransferase
MILLTPGPANTTDAVKQAMAGPDVCHREKSFAGVVASIRADLLELAGVADTHEVVLFTGSGTCAVDAAMSAVVPPDGRLLILVNGSYGVRMTEMARVYGVPFETCETEWHTRPDPAEVAKRDFTHVAMVHHETSTGILNPLDEIAAICAERGAPLILDAISSFAGIPVTATDVMLASSNKALQAMPGIGMAFVRKDLLGRMTQRSYYTSIGAEHEKVAASGQMRFTPAAQVLLSLRQALDETIAETLPGRFARYRANWEALNAGMQEQGFAKLLPDEHESGLLTSFIKPQSEGYSFDRHHDLLLDEGYVIYPAMVGYQHTFRLGNIGQITPDDIAGFLAANARVIARLQ